MGLLQHVPFLLLLPRPCYLFPRVTSRCMLKGAALEHAYQQFYAKCCDIHGKMKESRLKFAERIEFRISRATWHHPSKCCAVCVAANRPKCTVCTPSKAGLRDAPYTTHTTPHGFLFNPIFFPNRYNTIYTCDDATGTHSTRHSPTVTYGVAWQMVPCSCK